MSTEKKAPAGSSTKDLARTLGKKELMGIAIGQIIGAGIMSMMGVAIAMTGRSANLAFMLSAVFTMCTFFPSIFITSCIRMRGGMYTQMAIFAGDKWAGYYSVVYFITNMSLAMYALSFAQYALALLPTGGATVILGVSAECKNPTKDIPFVIVTSTVGVALLYGLVATTASGVLPVAEVANQPLTLVAAEILPRPLYIFFIVGGAMFALATTLNSQIMSATKPIMQACEDGWFPKSLAERSRYKTPWKIMLIFYIVLVVPILLDLEIAQISSLVQILGYINNLVLTTTAVKLPKMFPEAWEKSRFRVPIPVFHALMVITCIAILIQASFMLSSMNIKLILFNTATMAFGFFWAFYRYGSDKAKPIVSYEMA